MAKIASPFYPHSWTRSRRPRSIILLVLVFAALTGCDLLTGSKPNAIITSPPSGSTFHEGEDIAIQSVSTDAKGVVRVELIVDGQIVRADAAPTPQDQFTLVQTWKATAGSHTIIVKSYNGANGASDPAAISISVLAGSAPPPVANTATPAPTSTTAPGGPSPTTAPVACTNNSAFIADVTVPDGTAITAGQTFNKIWRLSNNGTCSWSIGYQFVFVSGEAMSANTVIAVPNTPPGGTADLLVPMTAPAAPGLHTGTWRMRSATAALFGQSVSVRISVPGAVAPTATPTLTPVAGCSGTPTIAFFNSDSATITAGSSTTLRWGAVTNADTVEIDKGIGGVAAGPTGGSQGVSPTSTTTYTMTAKCGTNTATKQVTITVPFTVLSVSANVIPTTYTGPPCPKLFNFEFVITVNGAGTVNWKREWSDGGIDSAPGSHVFAGAGTFTVNDSWNLGPSGTRTFWERLHVTSPNDITSSQATFTLTCP